MSHWSQSEVNSNGKKTIFERWHQPLRVSWPHPLINIKSFQFTISRKIFSKGLYLRQWSMMHCSPLSLGQSSILLHHCSKQLHTVQHCDEILASALLVLLSVFPSQHHSCFSTLMYDWKTKRKVQLL